MARSRHHVAATALVGLTIALAACQPSADDRDAEATATVAAASEAIASEESVVATQIVDAPFGSVRIQQISIIDGSHAESGRLAISYLDGDKVKKSYPKAVELGSFGAMSGFKVDNSFSDYPMVVSEGGGTWQGNTCTWTVLTELRPSGPVEVAQFESAYDNSGAVEQSATKVAGEISAVARDQSFTVTFTGTRAFTALYVRDGNNGYKLQGGKDNQLGGC